jgi:hypothetical protein
MQMPHKDADALALLDFPSREGERQGNRAAVESACTAWLSGTTTCQIGN